MDGQDYLNQISASVRPEKSGNKFTNLFSSKIFRVSALGLIALIVIIILGAIINGGRGSVKDDSINLLLHIDRTAATMSVYQPSIKSSALRSNSASAYGVLMNTSRELTSWLETEYAYEERNVEKTILAEADLAAESLDSKLFEAKINGLLDRIYAHKIAYEISTITAAEVSLYNETSDANLRALLNTSYASLNNLYDNFNDFSETK